MPLVIISIVILGFASIFQFNITKNSFTTALLLFGIVTVAYSFFILNASLKEYKTGEKRQSTTYIALMAFAIVSISGLSFLLITKPVGWNAALILSLTGMTIGFIITPKITSSVFDILIKKRAGKKHFPWTFLGLAKSIFAFTYFVLASLVLTLLGIIFVKLNPFDKENGKLIYHRCISKFCWSLMYIMGNVKKRIVNPLREDFSKPAIIICNHQSFLDILSTVMLYPKLILFTNHWVWNSPVFGFVVRMGDYYPVMQGADGSIDLVADRINHGYSVVVFPEGTRSLDSNMKRFHKGAFYLAEKLNLDILPIMIHGSGYTMSKSDFLLKDGTITLEFLPRIMATDSRFGANYTERAKLIGKYFRAEYAQIRERLETPHFYKEQLIYNYIYKGPVLEWYARIKIRLEKNYAFFNELMPRKGKILDAGCGYGFMSYMLHFVAPDREVTGVDYDENKIATANHCFSKNEKMDFVNTDITKFQFENYDGIILSDVLHYLQPAQQKITIEKCLDSLNENGVLVIRDGNKDLEARHKGTKLTELFSTKIFNFNKISQEGLFFLSGNMIREIAAQQKMECKEIDATKFTSNIIFIIKKQTTNQYATL